MDNESKTVEEGFADLMHRVEIAEEQKTKIKFKKSKNAISNSQSRIY